MSFDFYIGSMCHIPALAHRKQRHLTRADIPNGTTSIGDAAFSLCPLLKQVTIPATVEHIGVAAFCGSGIEVATFLGVPKEIEQSVFAGCKALTRIVIPKGSKAYFAKFFNESLIQETETDIPQPSQTTPSLPQPAIVDKLTDLFGNPIVKRVKFIYNYREFSWAVGDSVSLDDLFSGPTTLYGDPSYQFRRKALFIFMKEATASKLPENAVEYDLPANTVSFMRKYKEKYGARSPRIFVFVCNDGQNAKVYDEVRFVKANQNTLTLKALLRQ